MLGFDTVHLSVVQLHDVVVTGSLVVKESRKTELRGQSHENNKIGAYVNDFPKGKTKIMKILYKV